ncbi:hypothetical protein, partial [Escherichia coli]|uniref:hypothetical protein n=1 Tax=Escherichia coli TaxID=562 RepID=UPI001BD6B052
MEQKNNTDKNTNKKKQITHKHTSPILRGFYNRYLTPFTITSHYAHRQNALNAILTQTPQKEMFSPG